MKQVFKKAIKAYCAAKGIEPAALAESAVIEIEGGRQVLKYEGKTLAEAPWEK